MWANENIAVVSLISCSITQPYLYLIISLSVFYSALTLPLSQTKKVWSIKVNQGRALCKRCGIFGFL